MNGIQRVSFTSNHVNTLAQLDAFDLQLKSITHPCSQRTALHSGIRLRWSTTGAPLVECGVCCAMINHVGSRLSMWILAGYVNHIFSISRCSSFILYTYMWRNPTKHFSSLLAALLPDSLTARVTACLLVVVVVCLSTMMHAPKSWNTHSRSARSTPLSSGLCRQPFLEWATLLC